MGSQSLFNSTRLSHSQISTYLDCQKKWDLVYNENVHHSTPLMEFGTMAHNVLYTREMPDEWEYQDLKSALGFTSWNTYFTTVLKEIDNFIADNGFEVVDKELKLEHEGFVGVIDLLLKKNDKYMICDYKFSSEVKGLSELEIDEQMYLYAALLSATRDIDIGDISICYISIPRKQYDYPKILKSGKLSTAASQLTTKELFLERLKELGLEYDDYKDYIENLRETPMLYFVHNRVNTERLKAILSNLSLVADEIRSKTEHRDSILEKWSYMCTKCAFYKECKNRG